MSKLSLVSTFAIALLATTACSKKADTSVGDENIRLNRENFELKQKNESLTRIFKKVTAVGDRLWVGVGFELDYNGAEKACNDIGFKLPIEEELLEYKKQNPAMNEDFSIKLNDKNFPVHVSNKTFTETDGAALCTKIDKSKEN